MIETIEQAVEIMNEWGEPRYVVLDGDVAIVRPDGGLCLRYSRAGAISIANAIVEGKITKQGGRTWADLKAARSGFTLVELLVVMMIVALISVVALPAILTATAERPLVDASAIVQARLVEARDLAARTGWAGLRLEPSPSLGLAFAADGSVDPDAPLAYTRIVPLVQPPPYAEGLAAIRTDGYPAEFAAWLLPGRLILEEAAFDAGGRRQNPTSWFWTVRVGETVTYQGRPYTVVGPMAVGPAGGNSEGFVNVGLPGTPSPLVRSYARGDFPAEFLYLANRVDDDRDGLTDEGWNGLDDDLDGLVDEADEWEAERWTSLVGPEGVPPSPYILTRRPVAASVGAVELPAGAAIEVGVRPEFVSVAPPAPGLLAANIERIDDLGRVRFARVRVGDAKLAARVPPGFSIPDTSAGLVFDAARVHVYADSRLVEGVL